MGWNLSVGTRHTGIVLLNQRINYYKGYAPPADDISWEKSYATHRNWTVLRHQPKKQIWAASTHAHGTVQHLVRYQLVATHKITNVVVKITVWQCSRRCVSEIQTEGISDKKRCHMCTRFINDLPSHQGTVL